MAANPRAAAVAALVRQEQDGFSNLVLDAELKRQKLEGRDKAFASAIFYTVLEHRGTLDYILEQFLPKGLAKLDAPVREILRAALAQARYMQVPVSAAVNEAVKLTRTFKKASASFGSMADLGIHKIDLMRYLIGSEITSVYSSMKVLDKKFPDGTPIEVDDNSVEVLTFANGALGTVTTSWTHYGEECNATTLFCEKGIMKLYADPQYSLKIVNADGTQVLYALDRLQTNDDAQQASSGVIDEFVAAVEEGRPSILDAEDIVRSMRAVFACLRSAEAEKAVAL